MSQQVFDAETLRKKHGLSPDTKVVTLRRCWTVWFDVNGNAPADARIASFATKELADQALTLFAAEKDDGKHVGIVVGGKRHTGLDSCSVEGYDFDTYYCVQEDWREDENILAVVVPTLGIVATSKPAA